MPQVRGHHDAGVIVIVSCVANEKGGTLKTHIATNLVRLLDGHAHLLYCEVKEPNAHFFAKLEILKGAVLWMLSC